MNQQELIELCDEYFSGAQLPPYHMDEIVTALKSLLTGEMVMVPAEPTEEMLDAQYRDAGLGRDLARKCWKQMLSAHKKVQL